MATAHLISLGILGRPFADLYLFPNIFTKTRNGLSPTLMAKRPFPYVFSVKLMKGVVCVDYHSFKHEGWRREN